MALCKLVHCLESNGKVALSSSHLIHTGTHFFLHSHHLFHVLLHNSWAHLLCLATQASTYFFPHPPFQSWITWPPPPTPTPALSFFSHLSPFIPANTVSDNNYLVLTMCSAQLCSFGETPIRGFQRVAACPENKAQNRPSRVYAWINPDLSDLVAKFG